MKANAGDRARRTGGFCCAQCHEVTLVMEGDLLPACSHCGHRIYDHIKEYNGLEDVSAERIARDNP